MQGVLYLAVELPHVYVECLCSMLSLRSPQHGAYEGPITVITDNPAMANMAACLCNSQSFIVPPWWDNDFPPEALKSRSLKTSLCNHLNFATYTTALFLDSDTLLARPVQPLFDWFENQGADLAALPYYRIAGENGYG